MTESLAGKIESVISRFVTWLDEYGETSCDHQSFYAGEFGRYAKSLYYRRPGVGTLLVAPMVLAEAFQPSARALFWKAQRFPIADAHYAMAFAFLADVYWTDRYYHRAVHFLEVLKRTRCLDYDEYCWGYPFDWETRTGTIKAGTPLITTIPYAYEAFAQVYRIDKDEKWRIIMRSIADHVACRYRDIEIGPDAATCAYTPAADDRCGVINAGAYRAFVLTRAAEDFSEDRYRRIGARNLNFVLASQNPDGSWFYAADGHRTFVDHFHTCFVLKALAKIEMLTGDPRCTKAVARGVAYYVRHLFDEQGLPKPFAVAPRLTVYRRELYDYAECLNLGTLLQGRFPELDERVSAILEDLLAAWQKPNGSFRSRRLLLGWDNVPMHRWAQSQIFRSLCYLKAQSVKAQVPEMRSAALASP